MKYKAIVFDMDGTLLDTLGGVIEACNKSFEFFGSDIKFTNEDGKYFIGAGSTEFAKRALARANVSNIVFEEYANKFVENYQIYQKTGTKPFDGLDRLLLNLKNNGLIIGICSNKPQHLLNEVTAQMYPNIPFDFVIGQSENVPCKPNTKMMDIVKEKFNLKTENIIYVGDSEYDYLFAKNCKVDCCIVKYGYGLYDYDFMNHVTYAVDTIQELETMLLK